MTHSPWPCCHPQSRGNEGHTALSFGLPNPTLRRAVGHWVVRRCVSQPDSFGLAPGAEGFVDEFGATVRVDAHDGASSASQANAQLLDCPHHHAFSLAWQRDQHEDGPYRVRAHHVWLILLCWLLRTHRFSIKGLLLRVVLLGSLFLRILRWRFLDGVGYAFRWCRDFCIRWLRHHSHRSSREHYGSSAFSFDVGVVVQFCFQVGWASWDPPIQPVLGVCLWGVCLLQHLTSVVVERPPPHDLKPRRAIT